MIFTQTRDQIQRWKNSTSLRQQPVAWETILAVASPYKHPPSHEMESEAASLNFLSDSLRYFLQEVLKGNDVGIKVASIGLAIMQTIHRHVLLAPLQIGLAVQLHQSINHHHFASHFLLDLLYHLGFCSCCYMYLFSSSWYSYHEVKNFEQNAAANQGMKISGLTNEFIQYIGDNVDHNIQTLDGHDTSHGMRIATVTPCTNQVCVVPRENVTMHDISSAGHIPIYFPHHENYTLVDIIYKAHPMFHGWLCHGSKDGNLFRCVLWNSGISFTARKEIEAPPFSLRSKPQVILLSSW